MPSSEVKASSACNSGRVTSQDDAPYGTQLPPPPPPSPPPPPQQQQQQPFNAIVCFCDVSLCAVGPFYPTQT